MSIQSVKVKRMELERLACEAENLLEIADQCDDLKLSKCLNDVVDAINAAIDVVEAEGSK